jgi:septum formation protein
MSALRVILASQSPRRRELLDLVGIAHEVQPADIDESYLAGETPREHAERLARGKAAVIAAARAGRARHRLATRSSSSTATCSASRGRARRRAHARAPRGRRTLVITAVAVAWRGETRSSVEEVGVTFHR